MTQYAPWPTALEEAVAELRYMEGWRFSLEITARDFEPDDHQRPIAGGLTFVILVPCYDSYHPEVYRPMHHYHPVPAATFNRAAWERWLLEHLLKTITHEACENFRFETRVPDDDQSPGTVLHTRRPFAPTHGPGDDPYVVNTYATEEQRRMSFRGVLNPEG
jgi:hypothetical protein